MPVKPITSRPLGLLLLLGLMLLASTAYHVRVMEVREPFWFGLDPPARPFYVSGSHGEISFLIAPSFRAGLKDGDRLLSVNGRPLTGTAIFGEELTRSHPGDVMTVTVLRNEAGHDPVEKTFSVHLIHSPRPEFSWERATGNLLLIVLPYLALLLGFWVVAARPRDPLAWLVLAVMMAYECFGEPSAEQWGPFMRDLAVAFRTASVASLPIWLLLFGIYFPEPLPPGTRWFKWNRLKWLFIVPLALFAAVEVATEIGHVENYAAVAFLDPLPKPLRIAAVNITYIAIGLSIAFILTKYQQAISSDSKRRLRLLFAGSAVGLAPFFLLTAAAVMMDVNLEVYFPRWLWLSTELLYYLFPLTLAYIIVVHRAMDVRVALRQGLQYAFARNGVMVIQAILTVAVFFAAVTLVAGGGRNRAEKVVLIMMGLVAVLGIRRGSETLRIWVDRRFFREAYDAEKILNELSDRVRTMIEPTSLLQTVATRLSETLHINRIAVLLGGSAYRPAYSIGCEAVSDLSFTAESATVKTLQAQPEPVHVYLEDHDSWIYREPGSTEAERAQLLRLETELLLPLSINDKLLGFISLGPKRSEEPFTSNDLRLLKSLATQTGLALENAKLVAAITEEVAQRERLNREVEIAREVQERLFPQELPPVAGLDYCGACRPAMGVGGDYYDFLALSGGELGIAIGDVSGKGIGAALLMAGLQASLRAEANRSGPMELATLIANVNRLMYQSSTSNRYATLFYAQYDPGTQMLTYVNAGHNQPMLFRKGEEVIRLATGGTVVGLLETFPYQQASLKLGPGDLLVAFTDGISETMNSSDEEWGEERLIQAVKTHIALPSNELISQITAAADIFASGADQHDDMTLVIIRVGNLISKHDISLSGSTPASR
jgi:sigma-B regulation protein RsbU (phosphoserine phosphatase)